MAPAIGEKGGPIRVFVLEDKGTARGVFLSWDAAEAYADEHNLSLEHLHEFVTRPGHPEHLHLLAAEWESGWEFQGEWKKEIPKWPTPPKRIRLDHYHLRGSSFLIFRQKEFPWSTGLLLKIDPMAPDSVLDQIGLEPPPTPKKPTQQWRPKLGALNSPRPADRIQDLHESPSESGLETGIPGKTLVTPPEMLSEEAMPLTKSASAGNKPSLGLRQPEKSLPSDSPASRKNISLRESAGTAARKRKPLKLRSKGTPEPIPEFTPIAQELPSSVSSVELAHMDQSGVVSAEGSESGEHPHKVIPLRLIIAIVAAVLGWGIGIFWVFRPQPTAQEIVVTVATLNPADVLTIEPGQVFFQLPVDPIYQQRWVRSLQMDPIERGTSIPIPTFHTLSTWSEPDKFIRPPYAEVEVREWWDIKQRNVAYGFTLSWDDGSILILDLESDMLIGWMRAHHLPTIFN